tara:strand:+ start:378 stop:605 length:228 start_codon:yes stop_codon:yes gene_type:complete
VDQVDQVVEHQVEIDVSLEEQEIHLLKVHHKEIMEVLLQGLVEQMLSVVAVVDLVEQDLMLTEALPKVVMVEREL